MRIIGASLGSAVAGILAPGLTVLAVAAGLLLVHTLWAWVIEIACDSAAARLYGAAAPEFWTAYAEAKAQVHRAELPRWQRPLRLAVRALPTHPPVRLRARICRAVHERAGRRPAGAQ